MGAQIVDENAALTYIELNLLRPSPLNTFEPGDISDLKGNILSCGLLTPPSVVGPTADGMYEILAGERRYHALTEIHKENPDLFAEVPCYVCGGNKMDQLEKQLIIESSNLETRDFDKNEHRFHILEILKKMEEQGDIGHKDVVLAAKSYMNCSARYGRMYMQVFKNDNEELKQLISDKKITVQLASRIAGLDEKKQSEAIKRIKNGEKPKNVVDDFAQNEPAHTKQTKSNNATSTLPAAENKETQKSDTGNAQSVHKENGNTPYGNYEKDYEDDSFAQITSEHNISAIDQAFFGGKSNIDPQLDTVGGLTSFDSGSEDNDEKLTKDVIRWCGRMLKKTDFTDLEEQAFEKMKDVLDYVSA